jgi:hypothetical protein
MRLLPILIGSALLSISFPSGAVDHEKPAHEEPAHPDGAQETSGPKDPASHQEIRTGPGNVNASVHADTAAKERTAPKPARPGTGKKGDSPGKPAPMPERRGQDRHADENGKGKAEVKATHPHKGEEAPEHHEEKADRPNEPHSEGADQGNVHTKPQHGEEPAKESAHLMSGHGEESVKEEPHGKNAHADGAPKEKAHGKLEHASTGGSHEATPHSTAKPDTAFMRASDWDRGNAEILGYVVKWNGKDGESDAQGKIVTERMFLHADGSADRNAAGKGDAEVLNSVLSCAGKDGNVPFSMQTAIKLSRRESLRLLAQDQSLQSWPGVTYRSLDCRVTPPRLRVLSSGGEAKRDTALGRWPVYTEEMLFTYVRAVPQRAGYHEEIWLQDWGGEGGLDPQPRFAEINVHSRTSEIRDVETWYVTVDREDGRRSEFWVSASGLHPVVRAALADHSVWTLQGLTREKYWSW